MGEKVVKMGGPNMNMGKVLKFVIPIIILVILAFESLTVVQAGHRGIIVQLGAVKPTVLGEGMHFKIPFIQDIVQVEVRVQKAESSASAASKDLQVVTTNMAVNFHMDPASVNKLYQTVGMDYKGRIVDPAIGESLKAVVARYTAEQLISKRSEVSLQVKELLSKKLSTYNMMLDEINITEFKFSDEFNRAIEQKQIAEQQALKSKLDLDRIKIEKEQTITRAQATAESLRLQRENVTPELVRMREIEVQQQAIEKWDGKLPSTTGGAIPFLNVQK
ncbi:prohibitin family protein [Aneurinibacillus aneurinilyticus]|jgi:regulator of protease activity HflC (stomatin/prohibitin superfamily)|uniref:SPFH/Band 7/PHB domain protein n=1 Tax=Aneurinibacillus aneurinilyticus ATCC 12856 TaxID=649747 RepID=U1WJ48_ANEAE|nr:prohibitin family protein [Aneurinibacillus aneurinilyticus]ERI08619.1 SPFH/Band 7/PHB domain protein [Aneurinibacillus aneurinilyticus ATCC 12856]MCI1693513.1 prohibitin family protein [Aneurinibacillus aneurinilyticus]MED0706143.1 prohibitin family protein [Aneurinibacillus aneurinilyticus]MED0725117.1 prohibitin family protein [Aneurinibacillus aneurinilyticus]MED0732717.1 prohibitin family protein [Aneurinibacillus aneurinilyticus]